MPNAAGQALRWPILSAHPLYFGQRSTRKSAQSFLGTDLIGPTMKGLKLLTLSPKLIPQRTFKPFPLFRSSPSLWPRPCASAKGTPGNPLCGDCPRPRPGAQGTSLAAPLPSALCRAPFLPHPAFPSCLAAFHQLQILSRLCDPAI